MVGAPSSNVELARHLYVLCNNEATKPSDWVAYRVETAGIKAGGRDRNYRPTPDLMQSVTLEEPDCRGANAALRVDHGNQAPLGSFTGTLVVAGAQLPQQHHPSDGGPKPRCVGTPRGGGAFAGKGCRSNAHRPARRW